MARRGLRAFLAVCAVSVLVISVGSNRARAATASWEFDEPTYDYGPVTPGSGPTEPHEFVLRNTGETSLGIAMYGIDWWGEYPLDPELFHITSEDCGQLEPGGSCAFQVSFNPLTIGPKGGSLSVATASGEPPPTGVKLSGEGAGPWVSISPPRMNLKPVVVGGAPSPVQVVRVENHGFLPMVIEGISFTDFFGEPQSPSPFRVVGGTCEEGVAVPGRGSCTIELVMDPWEPGFNQSRLSISDNAPRSPQSIEVQGDGEPPPPSEEWRGGGGTVIVLGPPDGKELSESFRSAGPTEPVAIAAKNTSVRITHHPARVGRKRSATIRFSVAPGDAITECELDRLGFRPCSDPIHYAHLQLGRHIFRVRAKGQSSASESPSARFRWHIEGRR